MKPRLLCFIIAIILLAVVGVVIAQESTCELQQSDVANLVNTVCSAVGENEVCYGNLLVNLVPQETLTNLDFNAPGDMAALNNVRSLFLSALNETDNTWGIAQMRLLAVSSQGAQDVTLVLFGDVQLDNEVEPEVTIPIYGQTFTNVRSSPFPEAVVVDSIQAGETVEAIGRLEDSSWLRVRMPETNVLGWVLADLVTPVAGGAFDELVIQADDEPYFGAMQAISLTTGNSGNCGNFETDGLLIQTPAGTARVTLLINEVTIELLPSGELGVTAFIQSNPENGMDINVIDGSAFVSADGSGYYVGAGSSTNVELDNTSSPTSSPTFPTTSEPDLLDTVVMLETVRDPDAPVTDGYTVDSTTDTDVEIVDATTGETGTGSGTDTAAPTVTPAPTCTKPGNACDAPGHNRGGGSDDNTNGSGGNGNNGNGNGSKNR